MTRLSRIYCPSCHRVAARIERLEEETPLATSEVPAAAGTIAITQPHTQVWSWAEGDKPVRAKSLSIVPLRAGAGSCMLVCQSCMAPFEVDLAEARDAARSRRDLKSRRAENDPPA